MATIRKRTLPSGKPVWQCDYKDQYGKRRAKQFARKRDADAFLASALGEIRKGTYVHSADAPVLAESIETWLTYCKGRIGVGGEDHLERATYEDYQGKVRKHLLHPDYGIGHHKVSLITSGVVDDFRLRMIDPGTRGRSQANAVKTVSVLRAYLCWAQDRGYIASNPLLGRRKRQHVRDDTRVTPPTHEVIEKLVRACPEDRSLYLRFAILTGLRASEQRGLRWRYVDLKEQAIEVVERVDKYQNVAPPKSAAGYRTIAIGPMLTNELREYKVSQGASLDELVFPGKDGGPLRHDTEMKAWFGPLREKIKAPHLRWHDLRHYAISCWIEAGLNPKVVQTRAGHSSIQITYDRYGHLLEKVQSGQEVAGIEGRLYQPGPRQFVASIPDSSLIEGRASKVHPSDDAKGSGN